ncbi:MAG: phenylalanine--tRNA ligase subunit alpha, partial [Chloroflexota bacterium]|nr:phenylalanine--tRNA ligase subunit alpha [Chloroflexota bacterium]
MLRQLEELKQHAQQELAGISSPKELEMWRVRYLGKKSELTTFLRSLAALPIEERKTAGAQANQLKAHLEESLALKEAALREAQLGALGKSE